MLVECERTCGRARPNACATRRDSGEIRGVDIDDIFSYHDVVRAKKNALQKGMNCGVGSPFVSMLIASSI
jgi:hypothetical protein